MTFSKNCTYSWGLLLSTYDRPTLYHWYNFFSPKLSVLISPCSVTKRAKGLFRHPKRPKRIGNFSFIFSYCTISKIAQPGNLHQHTFREVCLCTQVAFIGTPLVNNLFIYTSYFCKLYFEKWVIFFSLGYRAWVFMVYFYSKD